MRRPRVGLRSVAEETASSVVFAALLHAIWAVLTRWVGWARIDLESVVILLLGGPEGDMSRGNPVVLSLADHPQEILSYFATLIPFAAALGTAISKGIRYLNLDKRLWFLRVGDEFHYVLLGEYQEFPRARRTPRRADGVWVAAATEAGGEAFLYQGLLEEFYYDSAGHLDRIVLSETSRRHLADDRKPSDARDEDARFYTIEGDYVVIPMSEVKNLNIRYVFVEFEGQAAELS